MAIDMSTVTNITLNNQEVTKIEDSLGNILWQKNVTPTEVIDKFPLATVAIVQEDGGPISNYTTITPNEMNNFSTQWPVTIDGEIYPNRIRITGDDGTESSLLQINVANDSTIYLICSSSSTSNPRTIYIDGIATSYVTPVSGAADKVALPMTSGIHTIGFNSNANVWGIIGNLYRQNNN